MFSRKIGSSKNRLKLLYYIIAAFMLILVLRTPIDSVLGFANRMVLPVKAKIYQGSSQIKGTFQNMRHFSDILEENKKLKFELSKSIQLTSRLKDIEAENNRLRSLLDIKKTRAPEFIAANISFRDGFSVYSEMYIDKGYDQGIKKDMVVLNEDKLLGRVKEVYQDNSLVELISKTDIYTSVLDQDNKSLSILKGTNSKLLEMEYITVDSDVHSGEKVYTSGLSDIYPKGIYVGNIKEIVGNDKQLFKKVLLELPYNIFDVNEVIILK